MAQVKFLWLLLDFVGVPIFILGILTNMDNMKSLILAILGASYLCARLYFYIVKSKQTVREKEYDLWHKSIDKMEREQEVKKKNGK